MFTILPTDVDYMLMGTATEPERSRYNCGADMVSGPFQYPETAQSAQRLTMLSILYILLRPATQWVDDQNVS